MQETQVQSLGQEDTLEKGMATHSSILAQRIPWTEEPDGLRHDWATVTFFLHDYKTENLQRKARGSVTKGRVVVSSSGEGKACGLKGAQKAYWESTWW